jgi:hypothetical protein
LHPSLAALYIVLKAGGDFSEIGRNHPDLQRHKFYQPHVMFPENIANLLPPSGDHWWELLGTVACVTHASRTRAMMRGDQVLSRQETLSMRDLREVRNEGKTSASDN